MLLMFFWSVGVCYYQMNILKNYDVIFNDDGLPVLDE